MQRRTFFLHAGAAGAGVLVMAEKANALKYYPLPSDLKCAVLYGTWCGSTRDAAVWISEGMGGIADVFDVRENPDLRVYDHIVVGGAIRSGVTPEELQTYLKRNQTVMNNKVRGLFSVCGNMRNPVGPEQISMHIDNHLAPLCGVEYVLSHVFLGRITKSLMDPDTAKMMSQMEDYDNLKRPECMAFGKEILESIS